MILDEIIANKREEIAAIRRSLDPRHLQDLLLDAPAPRPFAAALSRADERMGLIAEIKKASPSAGVIQPDFDPLRQGLAYQAADADCLSILTDEKYFQGHLDYLRQVRAEVSLPVLRKDFTVDAYQIIEARAAGADAVLLIVAALDSGRLGEFHHQARELGMDALVEVHTEEEMETALTLGAKLIGINSRNLKTFEVDLGVVERIAAMIPPDGGITLVGESGIKLNADVSRLRRAGVSAVLVGETLMRAGLDNLATAVSELLAAG